MSDFCNNSLPSDERYIVVATTNQNKYFEFRTGLGQINLPVYPLTRFPQIQEPEENGDTFEKNALIKAEHYYAHLRKPVLAEDSGLVIPALSNFPGVHSARIGATDRERIDVVLQRLSELPKDVEWDAYYECAVVLKNEERSYIEHGRCDGVLIAELRGERGFGYDPVFIPKGSNRTFGEMSIKEKSQYSHRGRAIHAIMPHILKEFRR